MSLETCPQYKMTLIAYNGDRSFVLSFNSEFMSLTQYDIIKGV